MLKILNLNEKNYLVFNYILIFILSFILTFSEIFNFEGKLSDTDFLFFVSLSFDEFLNIIKNDIGIWRIIAFTLEYITPKVFSEFPYKSHILLITLFITNYILCEKILSLINISSNMRILIFATLTSSILILPTVLHWTRSQNELLSVLISWFFVSKIVKSQNFYLTTSLVIIWGIIALLSYELHFPFLIILLFCFGYVPIKIIFLGLILLPFVVIIIPVNDQKFYVDSSHLISSILGIAQYIEFKLIEFILFLKRINFSNIIIPIIVVSVIGSFYKIYTNKLDFKPSYSLVNYLMIVLFSLFLLLVFYSISWTSSDEEIYSNGKISWNILNVFLMNILVGFTYKFKNNFLNFIMLLPFFGIMILSGILARILKSNLVSKDFLFLNDSIFKNVLVFIY